MNDHSLFLSRDVYFCLTDRYCIFLDLRADKYLCAGRSDMIALGPHLHGWNSQLEVLTSDVPAADPVSFAEKLLSAGILTRDQASARLAEPTATFPSHVELHSVDIPRTVPTVTDWWRFCWTAASAHSSLKHTELLRVVERIETQKCRMAAAGEAADLDFVKVLVGKFKALRSSFPRSYLCLYDSLALVRFLSKFRVFPDWVFGVRSDPFIAHCWVEYHSSVLNDTVDEVRGYTPIMRI